MRSIVVLSLFIPELHTQLDSWSEKASVKREVPPPPFGPHGELCPQKC